VGGKRNPPNLGLTGRSGVELRTCLNARFVIVKIKLQLFFEFDYQFHIKLIN
jgi:hypothetical protein